MHCLNGKGQKLFCFEGPKASIVSSGMLAEAQILTYICKPHSFPASSRHTKGQRLVSSSVGVAREQWVLQA